MLNKKQAYFFFALLTLTQGLKNQQQRVNLQVYYETLCPDSQVFIADQLHPAYQKLGKYLNVEFVPFGFASYLPNSNGGWNFACQHGPNECQGNLFNACLVDALKDNNQLLVEVISCIMSDSSPHTATAKCMQTTNVSNPSYEEIELCASSAVGENLLHDFGVQTESLEPPCNFIPWITVENAWNGDVFDQILNDLEGFLCSNLLSSVPECTN